MNEVTLLQVKTHRSTFKEFDCRIQTQNCEINKLQEKQIMFSHKINYICNFIEQIYFQKFIWYNLAVRLMDFFMNTPRCLFNCVTHNSVISFCGFWRGAIASYTAKDKFSIKTRFLNYTIQLTRACSSITPVSWFASACVRTQSIAAHRIYVTAVRVGRTFVDV